MTLGFITDLFFIGLIIGLIWVWPKSRSKISFLLFAEFCIFIGFNIVMNQFEELPLWYDAVMALANTAFVFGFLLLKSKYLACISASIVFYHIFVFISLCLNIELFYNYPIMVAFSLLQIIGMPGVFYGIRDFKHRVVTYFSRDSNDHHCVHR